MKRKKWEPGAVIRHLHKTDCLPGRQVWSSFTFYGKELSTGAVRGAPKMNVPQVVLLRWHRRTRWWWGRCRRWTWNTTTNTRHVADTLGVTSGSVQLAPTDECGMVAPPNADSGAEMSSPGHFPCELLNLFQVDTDDSLTLRTSHGFTTFVPETKQQSTRWKHKSPSPHESSRRRH